MHENTNADDDGNDAEQVESMDLRVVRDYHMDPEVAEETGEDPVDTILAPERDYGEFPFRVLEAVEMRALYGENAPSDDDLPNVGDDPVLFGTVYWTDEDGFLRFEWSDEFRPDETDEEGF